MTTYSACTCHKRPSLDEKYPPNETPAALALWNLATTPDETIPAGTLFVEKWSNGHYGPPETESVEILPTDNIGPNFTCERRILVPAQETSRHLTPDAITDEMVERAAHRMAMREMPVTYSSDPAETAAAFHDLAREVLHAALTDPPARPEGAEDIERVILDYKRENAGRGYSEAEIADRIAEEMNR